VYVRVSAGDSGFNLPHLLSRVEEVMTFGSPASAQEVEAVLACVHAPFMPAGSERDAPQHFTHRSDRVQCRALWLMSRGREEDATAVS
jgi:hypothetical protein